jgi:hypothetical protein
MTRVLCIWQHPKQKEHLRKGAVYMAGAVELSKIAEMGKRRKLQEQHRHF